MLDLLIERTSNTPKIDFKVNEGLLTIEGRSIPENPAEFFKPIINWVADYFAITKIKTELVIKLEYINSGSSKSLLEFLRRFKDESAKGHECVIKWYYEEDDESVQELGEHYQHTLKIPFEFISY
jgi:hypothetical protein